MAVSIPIKIRICTTISAFFPFSHAIAHSDFAE